ncbi:discoidin domain-containing protein [Actinacidiphila guanduensis]|uniref:Right handed beta helix region n=1 Tax=Actinacidiphila guanduensis TaxID=310781 RepID=A0A1G9WFY9_9ACTN|nr:discoidin domain-containing protein [Actinacidiphila guanduensis]SDM83227.1 Right handed beta helix region [Actinacidiphila guanduensis]
MSIPPLRLRLPRGLRAAATALAAFSLAAAAVPLAAVPAQAHPGPAPLTLYVSPTGRATGNGTLKHPFGSLEQARDHIRQLHRPADRDIDVELLDGTYQLSSTFTLTPQDSAADGHRITYEAAPGAHPVVSGGRQVTGWSLADPAHHVYKAHVGDIDTRQLWVDGKLETRARSGKNPAGFTKTATGYTITDTSLDAYKNQSDMEVVSAWGWMLMRCPVQSIVGTTMTIQQPCFHNANLHQGEEIQNPTWLENARELLDTPGEWYLDKSAGDLYYMPESGQDLRTATVTVPRLQDLVDLDGTAAHPVSGISFRGITFSYSSWLAPSSPDGMIEGQAGFRIVGNDNPDFDSTRLKWVKTPGAVNVSHGHGIGFEGDTFTHLGAVGLNLNTGTQGTDITGNVFKEIAATGVQVGGTDVVDAHPSDPRDITKDNTVANNVVTNVADQYNGSLGVFAGYTDHTVITHNKIYDLPYSGISVGWGWGLTDKGGDTNYPGNSGVPIWDTPTISRDTIVTDNEIGDIMKSQADGGAIYTLSADPGGLVAGNYINGTTPTAYGAIYHDEGSRYWTNTGNALCNVGYQWLFLNHGMNIKVSDNFTTTSAFSTQANSTDSTITGTTVVGGCDQLPASIVDNAGLQPQYRHLDPDPASSDHTAPTAPGTPTAVTDFPTVADLSWPASTDDTGVTGYAIRQDGKLVSASGTTSVRIPDLTAGATYTFTVTARDAAGNESAASRPLTVTMPDGTDLAQGKPVTVSSYSDPNTPQLAVDGDLSTRWAQGLGLPDPSWIQVDLGAQYDVTGAITTFEKASGYKYRIEVSPDEAHWTTLDDHTADPTSEQTNYSSATTPVHGRYVRLTVTGSNYSGGSIYELQVYGSALPPSTDHTAPSAPGTPTATALLPSLLQLSWPAATDDTGVTSYAVYQDGKRIAVTDATTLKVPGLTPQTAYTFTVVARDAALNASQPSPALDVTTPSDHDLAQGKPVTVSSYSEPNTPQLAVDGDLSTRWAQGLGLPDPSWIQVDLGAVTPVSAVVTTFEKSGGYQYLLEYSADGLNWSTLDDHTASATTAQTNYSFAGDSPVSARYLRLTVTGSSYNGGSIYELQAYGGF